MEVLPGVRFPNLVNHGAAIVGQCYVPGTMRWPRRSMSSEPSGNRWANDRSIDQSGADRCKLHSNRCAGGCINRVDFGIPLCALRCQIPDTTSASSEEPQLREDGPPACSLNNFELTAVSPSVAKV